MPLHEPDAEDPMELVGVRLPAADDESVRLMADCFAEEFARLGYAPRAILEMFRDPFYAAAHDAWRLLGDEHVRGLVETYCRAFGSWREGATFEV